MFQRWTRRASILMLLAGCTGAIDRGGGPGAGGGPDDKGTGGKGNPLPPLGPDPMATGACKTPTPGPSPLRRLSRAEYANTVVELFGAQAADAVNFIREARVNGFDNNAQSRAVSNLLAQEYFETAEKVSTAAVGKLSDLIGCDPAAQGEPACLDRFLDGFGKRVWRRPLEPAERDSLKQVFTQGRTAAFADGIQAVLQVMLLSPQFMYRLEKGVPVTGASYLRLDPYEMASRLSYLLWGSMPDAALFAAADAGKLSTREEVKAQAQRMLGDPRTARMVSTFTNEWLRLDEIGDIEKQAEP